VINKIQIGHSTALRSQPIFKQRKVSTNIFSQKSEHFDQVSLEFFTNCIKNYRQSLHIRRGGKEWKLLYL